VLRVDSAVRPAGNGVLSAVADDEQYPRQRHNDCQILWRLAVVTPVDYDDELVPTSIYHTKQYNVTVASNCIAAEVLERSDIAIKMTFLKGDRVTVKKRKTTMILKINCVDACVGRYWPCSINVVVALRRVLVPRLRDDQDVELLVDDVTTQHCHLIAKRLRVDAAN